MRYVLQLLALLLLVPVASSQQPTPCTQPEVAALDFWLGTWDLTWTNADGSDGKGTNTIAKTLGGWVVLEDFQDTTPGGTGFAGQSVSVFDARSGLWKQTWVDNAGGYLLFTGTPDAEPMEVRTAPFQNPQGQTQINRMTWTDVTDDALTWRWQRSTDDGATWTDMWVVAYTRAE
ncbi:MAG: DUF1579 family protein [Bacteroidota bacterium]